MKINKIIIQKGELEMKLFGKKKESEVCGCGGNCDNTDILTEKNESCCNEDECYVKVLGSGCAKCNTLSEHAKDALEQLNMDTCIQKITDFSEIATYGVMSTPALVLGNKVVSTGKVLTTTEIKELIEKENK